MNAEGITSESKQTSLAEMAALYLRLGTTAFGGPAAHIAMMQDEMVRRRGWLTEEQFLDYLSACNLIPGPSSTELAIYIGFKRCGLVGLLVAGLGFILPAALMVAAIAWFYVRFSHLPALQQMMTGIKPVVIAIILQALIALSQSALKNSKQRWLALGAVTLCVCGVNPLVLLLVAGTASLLFSWWHDRAHIDRLRALAVVAALLTACGVVGCLSLPMNNGARIASADTFNLQRLFLYFLKIGSVVYGSGYVLLAFLRTDLVQNWHWLTSAQLLDAAAVGQLTPGPVFTTATFIGFLLGGLPGAALATAAIFLPSFFLVLLTARFVDRARTSPIAGAVLDGVNVGSLALMASVTFQLGHDAITSPWSFAELIIAAIVLWRFKTNASLLIAAGALAGLVMKR